MTSSLIPALAVTAAVSGTPPTPVTDSEHDGLLRALAAAPIHVTRVECATPCALC